jgi:acetyl-CoA synthetase
VINVAGHRLGTKELQSTCLTVDEIAEAAAVPVIDDLRGRAVEMYVALKPGVQPSDEIKKKIVEAIDREIARPHNVWIVPDMPKPATTRRRLDDRKRFLAIALFGGS